MTLPQRAVPEDLADRIYEASVIPELWPDVLRGLTQASGTAWSTLVSVSGADVRWVASSPQADEIIKAHFEQFGSNLRTTRLLAKAHPGFITDYDILTQEEIDAEPVYRDFLIPRGYGYGVGTNILPSPGDMIVVHCENLFASGPVQSDVVGRLDVLRPHLARSAFLSARLSFERARTAVETLAALGLAACAVAASGKVLIANREFEMATDIWTTRGLDHIVLLDKRANRLLVEALDTPGIRQVTRSIAVRGETGQAVLHIVPMRRSARDLFSRAIAILVLAKTVDASITATPLLQALFDLSATEADVAARICAGNSVEKIAAADAKSVHTVRNQLKSVLHKTGCHRQVDLVRLLSRLILPGG